MQEGATHYPNHVGVDCPEDIAAAEKYLAFCEGRGKPFTQHNKATRGNKHNPQTLYGEHQHHCVDASIVLDRRLAGRST